MKSSILKTLLLSSFIFVLAISTKKVAHQILQYGIQKEKPKLTINHQAQKFSQIKVEKRNGFNWALHEINLYETQIMKSKDIIVAVIDTGIDLHHINLKDQLWINEGETGFDDFGNSKKTNGIDDDKNGYIDDVNGWNFVANNNNVQDFNGHGTHISGIIAAKNNGSMQGVAPNAKLMVLKYYSPGLSGKQNLKNTVKAIEYATLMGAKIINYSAGGTLPSSEEKAAIEAAAKQNILFVAAAGNNSENSDFQAFYPANYKLPNILSVTAINQKRNILSSSNFGLKSVDIAAPGNKIYSTLPKNRYGFLTGTSQATAFVTGLAALTWGSKTYYEDPREIINHLLASGHFEQSLINKSKSAKILNSKRSIAMASLYSDAFGRPNYGNNQIFNFSPSDKIEALTIPITLEERKPSFSLHQIKGWFFGFF